MERKHEEYILANLGKLHVKQIARDLGLKERTVRRFIETQKHDSTVTPDTLASFQKPVPGSARPTGPTPAGLPVHSTGKAFFRRFFLPIMLVLGCAAYSNTLNSTFHYDDFPVIVHNKVIRDITNPIAIMDLFNTRALVGLSFALNYAFHQLDVTGYHVFNIAVHLGASALVWTFVLALFRTPALAGKPLAARKHLLAFFAGLLFALHPIQTMAVTYIWQRAASMSTFFYLLALIGYIRGRTGWGFRGYLLAAATCLAAMFTKENSATLPLAIVLIEALFFASEPLAARARRAAPFLLFLAVIPITYMRPRDTSSRFFTAPTAQSAAGVSLTEWDPKISSTEYRLTQINVARTYLRLMVLPIRQSVVYNYPRVKSLGHPSVLLSLLLHAALLILALRQARARPLLAFGIFWFYLNILIEAYMPLTDVIFEHRVYLPLVGFALFVPALVTEFLEARRAAALLTAAAIALGVATFARNRVWKDEYTLWSDAAKKSPDDPRPYVDLGNYALKQKDFAKAAEFYEKTISLGSTYTMDYTNLGIAYLYLEDQDKALENFEKAIARAAGDFKTKSLGIAYTNAAAIYDIRGDGAKALDAFQKAIQADPKLDPSYAAICALYFKRGDADLAIEYGKKTLQTHPEFTDTRFNLGVISHQTGRFEEVRAQAEALKKLGQTDFAERLEQMLDGSAADMEEAT